MDRDGDKRECMRQKVGRVADREINRKCENGDERRDREIETQRD